jgi:mannosyl-oligosaccharide glucosidase
MMMTNRLFLLLLVQINIVLCIDEVQRSLGGHMLGIAELDALSAGQVHSAAVDVDSLHRQLFWGTYRPGLYFGVKNRSDRPLEVGLLWTAVARRGHAESAVESLRYECEQNDEIQPYGWLEHNGRDYGREEIVDRQFDVHLNVSFLQQGDDWSARVLATSTAGGSKVPHMVALIWYVATADRGCALTVDEKASKRKTASPTKSDAIVEGESAQLGMFGVHAKFADAQRVPATAFADEKRAKVLPDFGRASYIGVRVRSSETWRARDIVANALRANLPESTGGAGEGGSSQRRRRRRRSQQQQQQQDGDAKKKSQRLHIMPQLPNQADDGANVFVVLQWVRVDGPAPARAELAFVSHRAHVEEARAATTAGTAAAAGIGRSLDDVRLRPSAERAVVNELLTGAPLDVALDEASRGYAAQLDERFPSLGDAPAPLRRMASAALANLVGGIGYWHGDSIVDYGERPWLDLAQPLMSAVPSRPFFPRGFLWDEGFHQLLVGRFDEPLSVECLRHWFNLMWDCGWIGREQIRGHEARSRVPPEFVAQHLDHANPPTLLLPLHRLLTHRGNLNDDDDNSAAIHPFIEHVYDRLKRWYAWFVRTQSSDRVEHAFRWRSRTVNHTLASGLDDYPRAPTPSDAELHLDLQCWMTMSASLLADVAGRLGRADDAAAFANDASRYAECIDALFWNEALRSYDDLADADARRHTNTLGYVSLFPLFFGLVDDDARLDAMLAHIDSGAQLWSVAGVRSLAADSPLFASGENYWRGPVWLNINYMLLAGLHRHYIERSERARDTYTRLRQTIVDNMLAEYERTGFIFEQYNPIDGTGQRSRPFTGWSALVVLIFAEQY